MKALILCSLLTAASSAMANSDEKITCEQFDKIESTSQLNDSMDEYKYIRLGFGELKVCFKTYGSHECGCFIQYTQKN